MKYSPPPPCGDWGPQVWIITSKSVVLLSDSGPIQTTCLQYCTKDQLTKHSLKSLGNIIEFRTSAAVTFEADIQLNGWYGRLTNLQQSTSRWSPAVSKTRLTKKSTVCQWNRRSEGQGRMLHHWTGLDVRHSWADWGHLWWLRSGTEPLNVPTGICHAQL